MVQARAVAVAVGVLAGLLAQPAAALADACDPEQCHRCRARCHDAQATGLQRHRGLRRGGLPSVALRQGGRPHRRADGRADRRARRRHRARPVDVQLAEGATGSVLYGDPSDPAWAPEHGRRAASRSRPSRHRAAQGRRRGCSGGAARSASAGRRRCSVPWRGRRRAPMRARTARSSATARSPAGPRDATPTASTVAGSATTRGRAGRSSRDTKGWDDTRNDCRFSDRANILTGYVGLTTRTARSSGRRVERRRSGRAREHLALRQLARRHRVLVGAAGPGVRPVHRERHALRRRLHVHELRHRRRRVRLLAHRDARERAQPRARPLGSASPWLTMYPQATQSSTFWRTLALGDVGDAQYLSVATSLSLESAPRLPRRAIASAAGAVAGPVV